MLERSNLGPLLNEFTLAYNLGDPQAARKFLGMGKLKSTKYVVKFDILKTEQVAAAQQGFDGRALGNMAGLLGVFGGSRGAAQAGTVGGAGVGSVQTSETTSVWIIGMRYKIINAETTEQVANGYTEEKMEVGATSHVGARRVAVAAGRRVARHDGPAAGPEDGLGHRQQVQVTRDVDAGIATPACRRRCRFRRATAGLTQLPGSDEWRT